MNHHLRSVALKPAEKLLPHGTPVLPRQISIWLFIQFDALEGYVWVDMERKCRVQTKGQSIKETSLRSF